MAIERQNPLPPGRYWIDVFGPNIPSFDEWAMNSPQIEVEASESFEKDEPPREWVLFKVKSPAVFEARIYGFPTIAEPGIKSSGDTVQRPPPEETPGIPDFLESLKTLGFIAAAGLGLGLAIKLFRR